MKNKNKKKTTQYDMGGNINASALTGILGTGLSMINPALGAVATPLLNSFGQGIDQQQNMNKVLNDYFNSMNQSTNPYGNYKDGGEIKIKDSKKGTFTAAAKRRGMSVKELESKVLANPENYSAAMRKKAQFSHNARKWKHEDGGEIQGYEDLIQYNGNSHENNGIDVTTTGIPTQSSNNEVEGGETTYRIKGKAYVFSDTLKIS